MFHFVHLSLNPNLQTKVTPNPLGSQPEHLAPEVALDAPYWLVYPDIPKGVWGIYPQALDRMNVEGDDYIDVYVYKPMIGKLTKLISNYVVTETRLIDDAHVSGVVIITSPVLMVKSKLVRVYKGDDNLGRIYVPYGDARCDLRFKSCTDRTLILAHY